MKLVVGLGNPGKKYEKTRHNLGFAVLDALLQKLAPVEKTKWQEDKKLRARIYKHKGELILLKPQTMMNNSGVAVKKLITNYQLPITHLWVVHDDLDLLLGKIKIVQGRGAAGHKGVESIIKELETNKFVRFRLGIGRPEHEFSEQEAEAFVLSPFRKEERSKAKRLVKNAVKAIKIAQDHGLARAMNQFN